MSVKLSKQEVDLATARLDKIIDKHRSFFSGWRESYFHIETDKPNINDLQKSQNDENN